MFLTILDSERTWAFEVATNVSPKSHRIRPLESGIESAPSAPSQRGSRWNSLSASVNARPVGSLAMRCDDEQEMADNIATVSLSRVARLS